MVGGAESHIIYKNFKSGFVHNIIKQAKGIQIIKKIFENNEKIK